MKKTTGSKPGAAKKEPSKAVASKKEPSKTGTTKKEPSKTGAAKTSTTAQPKKGISNTACEKKQTTTTKKTEVKEKNVNTDKRAFVSGEAPKKIDKDNLKRRSNMKCIKTIEAHDDWVEKVLLLGNGKVITTSQDGTIKAWDVIKEEKKPLVVLEGHTEAVMDVIEFGKDKIISTSKDKTIRKWNVGSGKELFCYTSDEPIYCVKKIDDTYIAVGGADKSIRILNFANDSVKDEDIPSLEVQRLEGHSDEVTALEIANDMLISSSMDKSINVWSLKDYKLLKKLEGHTEGVKCIKLLKDGTLASGSFDNSIKVWDLKSFTCIKTLTGHTGHIFALNQLPDGRIISGASDWSMIVWSNETNKPDFVLEGHEEAVYSIDIFPDGKIISGSVDQKIKLWD